MRTFKYYDIVLGAFVAVLLTSNLISVKKLVTLDLPWFGSVTFVAASLFFPISYVFGDLLTEVYGYKQARRVIWTGLAALLFAALQAAIVLELPAASNWPHQEQMQWAFGGAWRIAAASLTAYTCGELVNSYVLSRMKIATRGRWLPARTIGSTIVGEAVDTAVFYPLAFIGVLPTDVLLGAMAINYVLKVMWEVVSTPVTVRVINWFKKVEGVDVYDA